MKTKHENVLESVHLSSNDLNGTNYYYSPLRELAHYGSSRIQIFKITTATNDSEVAQDVDKYKAHDDSTVAPGKVTIMKSARFVAKVGKPSEGLVITSAIVSEYGEVGEHEAADSNSLYDLTLQRESSIQLEGKPAPSCKTNGVPRYLACSNATQEDREVFRVKTQLKCIDDALGIVPNPNHNMQGCCKHIANEVSIV